MHDNLKPALEHILAAEGGFAERATEPGGSVNMGVSRQTLTHWRRQHDQPDPDVEAVRTLTQGEAEDIYESMYANAVHFDDLPPGVDYCVLDAAVNEGVGGAVRLFSRALGQSTQDTEVLAKLASGDTGASIDVIDHMCNARLAAKRLRDEWPRFGHGWTNRIETVRRHAKEMADVGRTDEHAGSADSA